MSCPLCSGRSRFLTGRRTGASGATVSRELFAMDLFKLLYIINLLSTLWRPGRENSTSSTRLRTVPHFESSCPCLPACLRVHLSRKECSTFSSHINLRSSSTAPLQPVSGQFPILKAAALACLPSSTSVPKRCSTIQLGLQHFMRKGLSQPSGSSTRRRICGGNRP